MKFNRLVVITTLPVILVSVKTITSSYFDWERMRPEKSHTGWTRSFIRSPTRSLDVMEIEAFTLYPGKSTHTYLIDRQNEQFYIVKEGRAHISINGIICNLPEGGIVRVAQGNRIIVKNNEASNLTYYSIRLKTKYIKTAVKPPKRENKFYVFPDTIKPELNPEGSERDIFNRTTASLKKLNIRSVILKSDFNGIEPQTHNEEEILLIRKGTVFGMLKGNNFRLGEGSVLFLTDEDPVQISNGGESECEYFVIRWLAWSQEQKK